MTRLSKSILISSSIIGVLSILIFLTFGDWNQEFQSLDYPLLLAFLLAIALSITLTILYSIIIGCTISVFVDSYRNERHENLFTRIFMRILSLALCIIICTVFAIVLFIICMTIDIIISQEIISDSNEIPEITYIISLPIYSSLSTIPFFYFFIIMVELMQPNAIYKREKKIKPLSSSFTTPPSIKQQVNTTPRNTTIKIKPPPAQAPRMNINTATAQEIQSLDPLILTMDARRIISEREAKGDYHSLAELRQRTGLSERIANNISKKVAFELTDNQGAAPKGRTVDF